MSSKPNDSIIMNAKKKSSGQFALARRLLLPGWLALAGLLPCPAQAAGEPPNIVLITIDTLRADHLGCYGYQQIRTPHIDGLAVEGVRFTKAYTPVPITLPSHTVMLTGAYPTRTGMHDFSGNRLHPAQPTLAAILRKRGYATGAVVGSAVLDSRFGLHRGFDYYYDNFDFSRLDERNLDAMERPGNQVVDRGLAWLEHNRKQDFFLWLHLYDPHHPYDPPAPYNVQYKTHPYDGEIAFVDSQVGRLVRYLKEKGLYERTLIVVVGDHGEGLGEHGESTHGLFLYDSTLRVPMIFRLPASRAPRAKIVDNAVSLADLLPTILQFLDLPIPKEVQGRSLLPLLRGQADLPSEGIYAETYLPRIHFNWSELRSIHFGRYHFIDAPKAELYDVAADPREIRNLFSQKKAAANELRKRLTQLIRQYSASAEEPTAEKTGLDPALMERLKSLGYVAVSAAGDAVLSDRSLPDPKDRIQMFELVSEAMADSQNGRYEESVRKLQASLKIEKDSLPVHYLLALNYYRVKDYAASVDEFQKVLHWSPKQAGKVAEGLAAFQQSVAISPDYAPGYEAMGEVLLFQGQVDQAIEALRKAVSLAPDSAKAHRALAKALQAKGLDQEAQEELKKAGPPPPR
ncbi:MAG: sulfatase-like hydrolase/transferase [Acidobacteria bacterium]|nr:sulfatase-like hydrolase/transferase [Acidobacteriota bacterium]